MNRLIGFGLAAGAAAAVLWWYAKRDKKEISVIAVVEVQEESVPLEVAPVEITPDTIADPAEAEDIAVSIPADEIVDLAQADDTAKCFYEDDNDAEDDEGEEDQEDEKDEEDEESDDEEDEETDDEEEDEEDEESDDEEEEIDYWASDEYYCDRNVGRNRRSGKGAYGNKEVYRGRQKTLPKLKMKNKKGKYYYNDCY